MPFCKDGVKETGGQRKKCSLTKNMELLRADLELDLASGPRAHAGCSYDTSRQATVPRSSAVRGSETYVHKIHTHSLFQGQRCALAYLIL